MFMDLELWKFIFSTAFLVLLLIKQHFDGSKLSERYFESTNIFRLMPKISESTVSCQSELLTQMRLLTQKMEAIKTSLERVADELSAPKL